MNQLIPKNDYEEIVERLSYEYVAYLYVDTKNNSPLLQIGDKIALKRKDYYEEKDMILYSNSGKYFIRRIISKSDTSFFVCGDNEYELRFIEEKAIIAKVLERQRGTKRYSLTLNRDKAYVNTIMKKAKILLKRHNVSEEKDTTDDKNIFKEASMSNGQIIDRKSKLKEKPNIPIDLKLLKELESFKSPIDKVNEYEDELARAIAKKRFQKQSVN